MAFLTPMDSSNSLGTSTGRMFTHSPQPVQADSSTYLGFLRMVTLKAPGFPDIFCTSEYVKRCILGCVAASTILGVIMQAEQSMVGKVLSSWIIRPPMLGFFSTR